MSEKSTKKPGIDELIQMQKNKIKQMQNKIYIYPTRVVSLSTGEAVWLPEGTDVEQRAFLKQKLIVHIRSLGEHSDKPKLTDDQIDKEADYWSKYVHPTTRSESLAFDDDFKQLIKKLGW